MPCPHLKIKITQRSKRQSAVAGAAYQSGESLFSEYDQKRKSYTEKRGIIYTEIMLPPNAPPEYADRGTLWNAVEAVEKQWNSQLARRFVVTFPREVPAEQYPDMIREYCNEHFVSKGMCCDLAIHDPDPPGHNPHCHIMLTMRAMDEKGKWLPKSRKVYDLDANGERIRLPSGNWKSHKEDTVDWNEQYHAEDWRHGWEVVQNRYLEMAGSTERVDGIKLFSDAIDQLFCYATWKDTTKIKNCGAVLSNEVEYEPSVYIEATDSAKYPWLSFVVTGEQLTMTQVSFAIYALYLPTKDSQCTQAVDTIEQNQKYQNRLITLKQAQNPKIKNYIESINEILISGLEAWLNNNNTSSMYD